MGRSRWWEGVFRVWEAGVRGRMPEPLGEVRSVPTTTREAHDAGLLESLPREAYADWLLEHGDVRGLVMLEEDEGFVQSVLEEHAEHFYGPFALRPRTYLAPEEELRVHPWWGNPGNGPPLQRLTVGWEAGYLRRLVIGVYSLSAIRALARFLAHPSCTFLEELYVAGWMEPPDEDLPPPPSRAIPRVLNTHGFLEHWFEGSERIERPRRPWGM